MPKIQYQYWYLLEGEKEMTIDKAAQLLDNATRAIQEARKNLIALADGIEHGSIKISNDRAWHISVALDKDLKKNQKVIKQLARNL